MALLQCIRILIGLMSTLLTAQNELAGEEEVITVVTIIVSQ